MNLKKKLFKLVHFCIKLFDQITEALVIFTLVTLFYFNKKD